MSLRTFHLLFIGFVLAVLAGLGWLMSNSEAISEEHRNWYSMSSYIFSALLIPYLLWFWLKTKALHNS